MPLDTAGVACLMDWVQAHFKEIVGAVAGLFVLSWLYGRLGRLFSHSARGKYYCRHCNWEGVPSKKEHRCLRCGSGDLSPLTH